MRTLVLILGLAMVSALAACGGDAGEVTPGAPYIGGPAIPGRLWPTFAVSRDTGKSWMAADAKNAGELLFESDPNTGNVDIFSLPDLTPKGRLTGFNVPLGECSDVHGNVWIVNFVSNELDEYSHAGRLLSKIASPTYYLWSCAVSPRDGAIVITVINRPHSRPGEVLWYSNASASPRILRNPEQAYDFFATFDPSGTLWVDGSDALGHFLLSKCTARKCATMQLTGGSIFAPGAVAWDDVHGRLVIFDAACRNVGTVCSYPVTIAGVVGSPTFYETHGDAMPCGVRQAALMRAGATLGVVGADNEAGCGSKQSTVDLWAYPKGKKPLNYHKEGTASPFGAAVSVK